MLELRGFATHEASSDLLFEVRRLMDAAFEGEFAEEDWEHTIGGRHVVVTEDGVIVAHTAVVSRVLTADDRPWRTGYLEGVATEPSKMGQGLGSLVMAEASRIVRGGYELGGLGTGRHHFYERLGWERWQGPTFAQDGENLIRTEEDDDGVMVLRFGPSEGLDLTGTLVCESRPGDDW